MAVDHDIELDEMLADAAEHLRDEGMNALSRAVETARTKLKPKQVGYGETCPGDGG